MKAVLAGAYGHLGSDILRELLKQGHEVVAADVIERTDLDLKGNFSFRKLDVSDPESLKGLCDGADIVITTVGLTKASKHVTNMEIDYQGNLNLLKEAERAGVKTFDYISVLTADQGPKDVPIIYSKYLFEQELIKSGVTYNIFRPSGYFYDIVNVFRPMVEKGKAQLLGKKPYKANVIDTADMASFVCEHMNDVNQCFDIGGKESWTYEEMARMCFEAAGKPFKVSYYPAWVFSMLASFAKMSGNGKEAVIRFSKWTLTHDMDAPIHYGDKSFQAYVKESFGEKQ